MPCRKAATYNGNPGAGKQGGGGFATEAECLEACKEGACCEGTACSIKPQCQCQGTGKAFKGVGTTCSPNPCGFGCCDNGIPQRPECSWCWCFCGEGAAKYPRFLNVTISGTYTMYQPIVDGNIDTGTRRQKQKSFSVTATLSATSQPAQDNCPSWMYGSPGDQGVLPLGGGGAVGYITAFLVYPTATSVQWNFSISLRDLTEFTSWYAPGSWVNCFSNGNTCYSSNSSNEESSIPGPYSSGTCLSALAGKSLPCAGDISATFTINGVQE